MKHCTGVYNHKGFTFSFSEMYQELMAEPSFLIDMFGYKTEVINFIS